MTLGDMLMTLRTLQYERVEIRNFEGNEIFNCPASSEGIIPFKDFDVTEWFPHGAPNKDATFTVYINAPTVETTKRKKTKKVVKRVDGTDWDSFED